LPAFAHHGSVSSDGSYQIGFHDPEVRFGDIHVVLARYPGFEFPRCTSLETGQIVPCATNPTRKKTLEEFHVTLYERVWGHEANHFLYAWTYDGSRYTLSIHRDRTVPRTILLRELDRILASLERIDPNGEPPTGTNAHMSGRPCGGRTTRTQKTRAQGSAARLARVRRRCKNRAPLEAV
jgi:hypothetical protein